LEVLDSVYTAADNKEVTVLISLDLSAAFDTVDHEVLLERLQTKFGVEGMPLTWLQSYLDDRTQYVKIGQHQSTAIQLEVGVPQGSVLGPILFAIYASPVADVIASHGVQYHQYADDTQLHLRCAPTTHPPDCPFLPHVLPTSDGGTCKTACSSTQTNRKH